MSADSFLKISFALTTLLYSININSNEVNEIKFQNEETKNAYLNDTHSLASGLVLGFQHLPSEDDKNGILEIVQRSDLSNKPLELFLGKNHVWAFKWPNPKLNTEAISSCSSFESFKHVINFCDIIPIFEIDTPPKMQSTLTRVSINKQ